MREIAAGAIGKGETNQMDCDIRRMLEWAHSELCCRDFNHHGGQDHRRRKDPRLDREELHGIQRRAEPSMESAQQVFSAHAEVENSIANTI